MNDNSSKKSINEIKENQTKNNLLLKNLVSNYDEGKEKLSMNEIKFHENVDFSLYYCLSESLTNCERVLKEKPSREISLVKTKIQEAIFWLNESE